MKKIIFAVFAFVLTFVGCKDKEDNKIKVELASDVDLEFDVNGKFLRIDK